VHIIKLEINCLNIPLMLMSIKSHTIPHYKTWVFIAINNGLKVLLRLWTILTMNERGPIIVQILNNLLINPPPNSFYTIRGIKQITGLYWSWSLNLRLHWFLHNLITSVKLKPFKEIIITPLIANPFTRVYLL
jgi:hypothetical protein